MNDPSERTRKDLERAKQEQKLQQARELWQESESVLNILRSQSGTPLKPATDEEIIKWAESR